MNCIIILAVAVIAFAAGYVLGVNMQQKADKESGEIKVLNPDDLMD